MQSISISLHKKIVALQNHIYTETVSEVKIVSAPWTRGSTTFKHFTADLFDNTCSKCAQGLKATYCKKLL